MRRESGIVYVGGNANNGLNAGAFYVNANNDSTNSNTNIGSALSSLKVFARFSLTSW
jgi:hypothetical protein